MNDHRHEIAASLANSMNLKKSFVEKEENGENKNGGDYVFLKSLPFKMIS